MITCIKKILSQFVAEMCEDDVKTGKNIEGIKPRIRYMCATSKSSVYYTTRDGEDKSNTPVSRDTKRSNQNL